MIMIDHKNNKPKEPVYIKEMVMAGSLFFITMLLLFGLLALWSVN